MHYCARGIDQSCADPVGTIVHKAVSFYDETIGSEGRLGYVLRRLKQRDALRRHHPMKTQDVMQVSGNAYPTTVLSHSRPHPASTVSPSTVSNGLLPAKYTKTSFETANSVSKNIVKPRQQLAEKGQSQANGQSVNKWVVTAAPLVSPRRNKSTPNHNYVNVVSKSQRYPKITKSPAQGFQKAVAISDKNTVISCKSYNNCTGSLKSYDTKEEIALYAYAHSSKLEPLLIGLYEATRTKELPPPLTWKTTVTPEFAQLAQNIIRLVKPNRVLVIGVYTGMGVLASALAINPRGLVVGIEYPQYLKYWDVAGDKFAQTAGLMRRIQIKADKPIPHALDALVSKEPGTFDLIILDDHALENYMMDYERALSLLRKGGAMIINDVLADGNVIASNFVRSPGGQLMDQMNKKIRGDQRVHATLFPFSGGVTLVVKK